jgi:hypothetical protein
MILRLKITTGPGTRRRRAEAAVEVEVAHRTRIIPISRLLSASSGRMASASKEKIVLLDTTMAEWVLMGGKNRRFDSIRLVFICRYTALHSISAQGLEHQRSHWLVAKGAELIEWDFSPPHRHGGGIIGVSLLSRRTACIIWMGSHRQSWAGLIWRSDMLMSLSVQLQCAGGSYSTPGGEWQTCRA